MMKIFKVKSKILVTKEVELVKIVSSEAVCEKKCFFNKADGMVLKAYYSLYCTKPKRLNCFHATFIELSKFKPGKRTRLIEH